MEIKFCPGCSAILEQLPRTVGGVPVMFWVCPEGDWEEPVSIDDEDVDDAGSAPTE